jgi:hypothetical protein
MAGNAASVPGTFGHKDRLHFGFEELKIKLGGLAGGSAGTLAQQAKQQSAIEENVRHRLIFP